jgi:hypothetical protein
VKAKQSDNFTQIRPQNQWGIDFNSQPHLSKKNKLLDNLNKKFN